MRNIKIAICSIVRDCNNNLKRNIPVIEKLRTYFKSSILIVFENDSIDGTKDIFIEWNKKSSNVYNESRDLNIQTIPTISIDSIVNKYFSSLLSG